MEAENRTATITLSVAIGIAFGLCAGAFSYYLISPLIAELTLKVLPITAKIIGGTASYIEPEGAATLSLFIGFVMAVGIGLEALQAISKISRLKFDHLMVAFGIVMVPAFFIQSQRDLTKSGCANACLGCTVNENGTKMTEIMMYENPEELMGFTTDFINLFETLSEEQIAQLEEIDWEEVEKLDREAGQLTMKGQPLLAQQESLEAKSLDIYFEVLVDRPDLPDLQFQKNQPLIESWVHCKEAPCPFLERRTIQIQWTIDLTQIIKPTHPHLSRKLTSIVSHLKELNQKWASLEKEMEELDQALRKANPAVFELPGFEGLVEKWSAPH